MPKSGIIANREISERPLAEREANCISGLKTLTFFEQILTCAQPSKASFSGSSIRYSQRTGKSTRPVN
jgi:hypothetical protein